MALFKKKKTYLYYKDKYYNTNEDEVRLSLTKKETDLHDIIMLPSKKKHLTKFDNKQKYKLKIELDKTEYGISTSELDVLYLFDYLYLKNNRAYSNILIRTPYFSIALVNNVNVIFIEHSKIEGENLQFFSLIFNGNEFINSNFDVLYNEVTGGDKQSNSVSIIFLFLIAYGFYYIVQEEEYVHVEDVEQYLVEENNQEIKKKKYELKTEQQKELLLYFRQRNFLNKILDFELNNRVSKMFQFIGGIDIDGKRDKYRYEIISLVLAEGFKRKGRFYKKVIKDDSYEKDLDYKNRLVLSIIKKEKEFKDFFMNNEKLILNHYSHRITKFLKSKDEEFRLKQLNKHLKKVIQEQNIFDMTNKIKEDYLKNNFGFKVEEITKGEVILILKQTIKAGKVFNLIKYLRNMNILVEKLKIKKISLNKMDSLFFKVNCKIKLKREKEE